MATPTDIYQTANELIKQHGDDAPIHAASRYWLPTCSGRVARQFAGVQ